MEGVQRTAAHMQRYGIKLHAAFSHAREASFSAAAARRAARRSVRTNNLITAC